MVETPYHIPGAPNLALLSDFHNTDPAPIISSLRLHRPSLICITGDIVYGAVEGDRSPLETQNNVLILLKACASLAPTFLSLGNHEWMLDDEDLKGIDSTNVVVLDNSWVEKDGLVIGGLTSGYVKDYRAFRSTTSDRSRYPRKDNTHTPDHKPDTSWLDSFAAKNQYKILLSHHPEIWPEIKSKNIELVLCGHAHGGQWRIFNRGVWAPGQGWWPRWTRGVYDGRLVVSAGLSNTTTIPRINNPTEIVYISSRFAPLPC